MLGSALVVVEYATELPDSFWASAFLAALLGYVLHQTVGLGRVWDWFMTENDEDFAERRRRREAEEAKTLLKREPTGDRKWSPGVGRGPLPAGGKDEAARA